MKLTVNNYLNARTGAASTSAPNPYYHEPGKVLEVDSVTTGTCIDGNAIWYHCAEDDHYYWSGGFTEKDFRIDGTHLHSFEHGQQVEILSSIQQAKEQGLKKDALQYLGTGIGYKNDDKELGLALILFVKEKDAQGTIPKEIDYCGIRIPTDVKPISFTTHHLNWDNFPLKMGGSINRPGEAGHGSRGVLLYKVDNGIENKDRVYLLTCYHVLFYSLIQKGQSSSYSGNRQEKAYIPEGNNKNPPVIIEGRYDNHYDYAILEVTDWHKTLNIKNQIDEPPATFNGMYTLSELAEKINADVKAYGSVSGMRKNKISHVNVSVTMEDTQMEFHNVIMANKLSTNGDSGGPVVDTNNKLVGYIIGGNELHSFIMPLDDIVYNKNYTILQ